jgi:tetratricopeptide (TPR) repeat protein
LSQPSADSLLWADRIHDLWIAGRSSEAQAAWLECSQLLPEPERPHLNHGNVLRDLNRFEEADHAYRRAMQLAPDGAQRQAVAWNHSQLLIGLERYDEAYALAEQRFGLPQQTTWRDHPYFRHGPRRDDLSPSGVGGGSQITLWSEQGFGDALQYLRWIVPLIQAGWRVRLEVEPPLLPLLREGLAWMGEQLSLQVKGIAPRPLDHPCQGSLLSLPHQCGGAPLASVFQSSGPGAPLRGYLRSPNWTPPPPRQGRRPRIGLVWACGRNLEDGFMRREYERRSLPRAALLTLLGGLAAAEADLICLQFGVDRGRAEGWSGRFAATLEDSVSLEPTARLIAGLDLVITIDSATAHLVGAMAQPGWVLLPWGSDPRWLRERSDSPWYPSLTLLRQPGHQDWPGLVELVLHRFRRWRDDWSRPQPLH